SLLIDLEVIHHRVHREWKRGLQFALRRLHEGVKPLLGLRLSLRSHHEAHPAATHAAKHPKAPEVRAEGRACVFDQSLGVEVRSPRDDGLDWAEKVARGGGTQFLNATRTQGCEHVIEHPQRFLSSFPFCCGTKKKLFRHHLENGSDVLRHAAVDEDET